MKTRKLGKLEVSEMTQLLQLVTKTAANPPRRTFGITIGCQKG